MLGPLPLFLQWFLLPHVSKSLQYAAKAKWYTPCKATQSTQQQCSTMLRSYEFLMTSPFLFYYLICFTTYLTGSHDLTAPERRWLVLSEQCWTSSSPLVPHHAGPKKSWFPIYCYRRGFLVYIFRKQSGAQWLSFFSYAGVTVFQMCTVGIKTNKRYLVLDWRDCSVVNSTVYSFGGPEFNSQKPCGGSQPSIVGPDACLWWAEEYTDRTLI